MNTNKNIGIIGLGMVGGAVNAWFTRATKYDLKKFPDGLSAVNKAEIVFICVPTPYSRKTGYNLQAVERAAQSLTGQKIVVLKSTVLPGTTTQFQKKYPQHTWLFHPEFLRDKSAVQDFLKADRQIIGMAKKTARHRAAAKRLMQLLPRAAYSAIVSSTEAELIKQFANAFGASKVVFANMMYDVCRLIGADYDQVRQGLGNDPRITGSWLNVWYEGYRGYSGKCFPKDMAAMMWWGKKKRHPLPLLELADSINWKMLPKSRRQR